VGHVQWQQQHDESMTTIRHLKKQEVYISLTNDQISGYDNYDAVYDYDS